MIRPSLVHVTHMGSECDATKKRCAQEFLVIVLLYYYYLYLFVMIFLQSSMLIAVHQWMAEQEQQSILISVIIFTLVWGNRSSCKVHPQQQQQHISYTWSSQQHDPQQSISDRCQSQWFAFSQPHIELNDGEWTWQFDWMSCDAIDLDCNSCDCWRSIDMVIVYWLSSSSSAVLPCNLYIDTIHSLLEAQHVRPSIHQSAIMDGLRCDLWKI